MIYTTFKEVLDDVLEIKLPVGAADKKAKWLGELADVYLNAVNNPPSDVIGVGAITYAEQTLIAHQTREQTNE